MHMYQSLLARLARALDTARIPYMVIGGQAVLLHGEPRLTRDVDITLGLDAREMNRVLDTGTAAGLVPAVNDVQAFVRETNVLPFLDSSTKIRVDLIFSFSEYETGAVSRAVAVTLDGMPVRFATVEDLIIHKLVAGRARGIEDVSGVLRRNHKLDEEYLNTWLPAFRETLNRDLLSEFRSLQDASSHPRRL